MRLVAVVLLLVLAGIAAYQWYLRAGAPGTPDARTHLKQNEAALAAEMDRYAEKPKRPEGE